MKTIIVWFRNDLRVRDHPALSAAANETAYVVPLFILNNTLLHGKYAAPNRNRFLEESLEDLRSSLKKIGSDLVIRSGDAAAELQKLVAETGADTVHYTIDYTPHARKRDNQVTESLAEHNVAMRAFPGKMAIDSFQGVVAKNGNVYKVFTPFWKNWSTIDRREVLDIPKSLPLPPGIDVGAMPELMEDADATKLSPDRLLVGGETAGLEQLHDFFDGRVQAYTDDHNRLVPKGGTSMLSPYLKFGCVSLRYIEDILPPGSGPAAFHRQLAWRDFYTYVLFHFPDNAKLEFQERYRDMEWSYDDARLEAWQTGQTGYPIIDAAMRQLRREGWMHNRSRLIVGSFLTKDLALDWRSGEKHFMQWLLDGDEINNNGNWQWIASVGVDPAPVFRRLYNPMTQQERYDPDGSYVRYYVPELKNVPDAYITEPWKMPAETQMAAHCIIGKDYPAPIVDHAQARKESLERYRKQ